MGLKKNKTVKFKRKPQGETVKIADLIREYNLIVDKKSTLSKSQRDLVVARVEKLKERGLLKTQTQPIEEQVAQIINSKDIN